MKVILTGSTGWIGGAVLQRCLQHPSITSIVALTRRPVDVTDPKLENIIHTDYTTYDQATIDKLKGAGACIWVLGSPRSTVEVHVTYTKAAVKMLLDHIVPQNPHTPFRFVYTSGHLVPYLESPLLGAFGNMLKARGVLDREVLNLENEYPGRWESFVVRPFFVVDQPNILNRMISSSYIYRTELSSAMVDMALNGGQPRLLDNQTLRARGQAVSAKDKA